ncbi:unnamed protein product [Urochloa humidicola]
MVLVSALRGDSVAAAAVADELLIIDDESGVDLETFFDHAALDEAAASGGKGGEEEEEELEWLSNKDAFPAVETMLPPPPPPPPPSPPRTTKGAPRPQPVVAKKAAGRRCRHCGTKKSAQWRTGPEGGGTLCNACGLRFRSGRLVPEYRPASSPNFSKELHSNYHRRIVEMLHSNYHRRIVSD